VVVSKEVVQALADAPQDEARPLRSHHLKHIGRVKLPALRRASSAVSGETLSRARERRDARRAWIAERMSERDA
jgi:hypothetical protein